MKQRIATLIASGLLALALFGDARAMERKQPSRLRRRSLTIQITLEPMPWAVFWELYLGRSEDGFRPARLREVLP